MNYILYNANFHASNTNGVSTGVLLWNAYMDYVPHKRTLSEFELGKRERVQRVRRFKGIENTGG